MSKTMIDVVNEFKSLIGLHLSELCKKYNKVCSCNWCAFIVSTLLEENLNITLSRSCTVTRNILRNHKDFIEIKNKNELEIGDIVLYDWDASGDCDHIGIISNVSDNEILILEGNVGSTDFTMSYVSEIEYNTYRKSKTVAIFRFKNNTDVPESYKIAPIVTVSTCDLNTGVKTDKLIAQSMLYVCGYYNGLIDGIFGNKTKTGIKNFQKNHNLKESGTLDKETWKELFETI